MTDPWACRVCAARYVVPILARDCEHRHETDQGVSLHDADDDPTDVRADAG